MRADLSMGGPWGLGVRWWERCLSLKGWRVNWGLTSGAGQEGEEPGFLFDGGGDIPTPTNHGTTVPGRQTKLRASIK